MRGGSIQELEVVCGRELLEAGGDLLAEPRIEGGIAGPRVVLPTRPSQRPAAQSDVTHLERDAVGVHVAARERDVFKERNVEIGA